MKGKVSNTVSDFVRTRAERPVVWFAISCDANLDRTLETYSAEVVPVEDERPEGKGLNLGRNCGVVVVSLCSQRRIFATLVEKNIRKNIRISRKSVIRTS